MRLDYLEGLRGWASLIVFFGHIGPMFLLYQGHLPVMPLFFDGELSVYIFFTLSAYALTINYFKTNDTDILISLGIRRYPRLTLPILASCVAAFIMMKLGLMYNLAAASIENNQWLGAFYNFTPTISSLLEYSLLDVYLSPEMPLYNGVLWTMFYEFIGSMALLFCLFCFRRNFIRITLSIIFTALCWYGSSPLGTFAIGALLAGLSHRIQRFSTIHTSISELAGWILLSFAIILASIRGALTTDPKIVLSMLSAVILTAIIMSTSMQKILALRLSVFLGKISYPLYLTHMLVICSWSSWLYIWLHEQSLSKTSISVAVFATSLPIAIYTAKLFYPAERAAITLSKRLSRMIYR